MSWEFAIRESLIKIKSILFFNSSLSAVTTVLAKEPKTVGLLGNTNIHDLNQEKKVLLESTSGVDFVALVLSV